MTHVTCRLTAKNRDQLLNPTLCNGVWATFTFFYHCVYGRERRARRVCAAFGCCVVHKRLNRSRFPRDLRWTAGSCEPDISRESDCGQLLSYVGATGATGPRGVSDAASCQLTVDNCCVAVCRCVGCYGCDGSSWRQRCGLVSTDCGQLLCCRM